MSDILCCMLGNWWRYWKIIWWLWIRIQRLLLLYVRQVSHMPTCQCKVSLWMQSCLELFYPWLLNNGWVICEEYICDSISINNMLAHLGVMSVYHSELSAVSFDYIFIFDCYSSANAYMLVYRMINTDNNAGMLIVCCVCSCVFLLYGECILYSYSFCDLCMPMYANVCQYMYQVLKSQWCSEIVGKIFESWTNNKVKISHLIPELSSRTEF